MASFANWVEEMRAETNTIGRGRRRTTKRKYSDELILGLPPKGINNPVDVGGGGRFGDVPMIG